MIYYFEHLFVWLFSIFIISLLRPVLIISPLFNLCCWLLRILNIFRWELFIRYVFSKYFSHMRAVFSFFNVLQSSSFILISLIYQLYTLLIVLLGLFMKAHHQTQVHLDFVLCCLLQTFKFCASHLGVWYILSCEKCKACI